MSSDRRNQDSGAPSQGSAAGAAPARNEVESSSARNRYSQLQSAVRFPLKLSVAMKSADHEQQAETQNISANGVLFQVDEDVPVGSTVDFCIALPAEVVGGRREVRLDCRGRVVRSFVEGGRRGVGVVIDEYHLEHC
jgi:hypothetical protein